jgi:molybdopterin biosynthesis enzyme
MIESLPGNPVSPMICGEDIHQTFTGKVPRGSLQLRSRQTNLDRADWYKREHYMRGRVDG